MDSPPLPFAGSDIGSSISRIRGPPSSISSYDPYTAGGYRTPHYRGYGAPSVRPYYSYTPSVPRSYYSYAPSATYSAYSGSGYSGYSGYPYSSQAASTGVGGERVYFNLNGKLVRSHKVRDYKRAQKHVLNLYPDLLQGVAASRIQFYVLRPGLSRGRHVGLKSFISKKAWPMEMDTLQDHETVGIEVRPSVTLTESLASLFNRSPFV